MNQSQFNQLAKKFSQTKSLRRLRLEQSLISSQLNWGDDNTRIQPETLQTMRLNYALRAQAINYQNSDEAACSLYRDEFNKINLQ